MVQFIIAIDVANRTLKEEDRRLNMTFRGRVQSGVVVFDGPQLPPEGSAVEVALVSGEKVELSGNDRGTLRDMLLEFAGTIEGLPSDMAAQHDHYIHGRPKR